MALLLSPSQSTIPSIVRLISLCACHYSSERIATIVAGSPVGSIFCNTLEQKEKEKK